MILRAGGNFTVQIIFNVYFALLAFFFIIFAPSFRMNALTTLTRKTSCV